MPTKKDQITLPQALVFTVCLACCGWAFTTLTEAERSSSQVPEINARLRNLERGAQDCRP